MGAVFQRWDRSEGEALAELLTGEDWPYHAGGRPDRRAVLDRVADGHYDGAAVRTFWVVDGGERVGLVRLFDLGDDSPMFDLRIRRAHRGRGLGRQAVDWLTAYLFEELPEARRVEATTRVDNHAMRRVLERCGYVQEARYRQAWPAGDGSVLDAVGYAILRSDRDGPPRRAVLDVAAAVVDCADPGRVAAFYAAACAGEVTRTDPDGVRVEIGGVPVVFRAVHRPPPDVPLQVRLDCVVDDLAAAEAELVRLGATPAASQPHRADGLVVMLDPAGHPFHIRPRP